MRIAPCILFSLIVAAACEVSSATAANVSDFIDFSLRSDRNALLLPGRLYVPPEASDPSSRRPLILFLHGAGESGTNNLAQINVNIDNLLAEAKQRGAFLYAPQTNASWGPITITNHINSMLDRAIAEQLVDISRIYATGLSMGGGGVWNVLNRFPERFAAAVPIAAVSPAADFVPATLLSEPIWAFHARNDSVVSATTSRNVVNSILSAAGESTPNYPSFRDSTTLFQFASQRLDLRYTESGSGGHGIWFGVYAYEPMYDWMFAHAVVPEPASLLLFGMAGAAMAIRRNRASTRS